MAHKRRKPARCWCSGKKVPSYEQEVISSQVLNVPSERSWTKFFSTPKTQWSVMFVHRPEVKLFATRNGPLNGTAILAIGGWIGSSELWLEPLAALSNAYMTISYDHRGSGLSSNAESITFENLIADAHTVLDAYGIQRCVLAAESAGAQTALALAARSPHRVSHLVIVAGLYDPDIALESDPFLQGLRSHYSATLEHFVQLCVPELDCEHIKAWGRKILARATPEAAIALRIVGSTTNVSEDIKSIRQPTLILHGSADRIVPLEQGRALARTLTNAEFMVLEGAGHVPTLTQPMRVAEAIRDFLHRHDA
jgi:pimeloyl-ACP methyl ester carboxylesterase